MNTQFKGTKGKWVADLRGWCCAVYPCNKTTDTNGMNHEMKEIFSFCSKGANYNGNNCIMDEEQQANALLISKAPEMLEMLDKAANKLYSVENPSTSCRILADEIIDLINESITL